jgi:hypothetical protein
MVGLDIFVVQELAYVSAVFHVFKEIPEPETYAIHKLTV